MLVIYRHIQLPGSHRFWTAALATLAFLLTVLWSRPLG